MTARRLARATRSAAPPEVAVSLLAPPEELIAGPCIEVWAPEFFQNVDAPWRQAPTCTHQRFRDARMSFLAAHGISWPYRPDRLPAWATRLGAPWSFEYLAAHGPDRLADLLTRRGLPARWRPTPVPDDVDLFTRYGPLLVPLSRPWVPGGESSTDPGPDPMPSTRRNPSPASAARSGRAVSTA